MNETAKEPRWIVGVTGCSGIAYGRKLLKTLLTGFDNIHLELVISDAAFEVLKAEEDLELNPDHFELRDFLGFESKRATLHANRNIGASIASGSYDVDGMVIAPCSMKTMAAICHGYSESLLLRAADVILKERRPLILVPRESPLSVVHLKNMLALAEMGAAIVPAMPGFYHRPQTLDDVVDMMVMRILDQMKLKTDMCPRWSPGNRQSGQ